jgi:hypothetical protein
MIPKKVDEPKNYDSNWCSRCDQYYCAYCIDFCEVDFDVEENAYEDRPYFSQNLKGEQVCPWCYNQLIDKAFPQLKPSKARSHN